MTNIDQTVISQFQPDDSDIQHQISGDRFDVTIQKIITKLKLKLNEEINRQSIDLTDSEYAEALLYLLDIVWSGLGDHFTELINLVIEDVEESNQIVSCIQRYVRTIRF